MSTDSRIDEAVQLYERAVFGGESGALEVADRELDAVEADLALARGRVVHARFLEQRLADPQELALFERAAQLYRALGDGRGEGEAVFWVGAFHQVVQGDEATAVPFFEQSLALATRAGDRLTMSYALRHLGFADHMAGRLESARERMEESVRLRRAVGFLPGVAANLIGLAHIAAAQDRRDDALRLIEEAAELAASVGAKGVLAWVEGSRAELAKA